MRARGVHCLVGMSLKRRPDLFPFPFWPWEAFPFPFLGWPFPFPLRSKVNPPPLPPTFYPALAGLMDIVHLESGQVIVNFPLIRQEELRKALEFDQIAFEYSSK